MSKDQESGQAEAEQIAKSELAQTDDSHLSESAQQVEGSSSDLAKRIEETRKDLTSRVEKLTKQQQSAKDKEFSNLRKEITQLQESVVALAELSKNAASAPASRGNEEQESALSAVQDVFVVAGFEKDKVLNSPEFIEYVKKSGGKFDTVGALSYLKELKSKPKQEVSAAAIAQPPGGGVVQDPQGELNEYIKNYTAAANSGDQSRAARLRQEAREKGLPIDTIEWQVS